MAEIKVNKGVWEKASEVEHADIIAHLKKYQVLSDGDSIIGDENIPAPSADTPLFSMSVGDVAIKGIFDDLKCPICKAACDAAAAAAVAACTAGGPALAACLAVIAAAREVCRNKCC